MTLNGDSKRYNACWEYFKPPRRLQGASFDNYIPKTKQQQAALETCQAYDLEKLKTGQGLFLVGPFGTGKTHLSVALVRNVLGANIELFGIREDTGGLGLYDCFREEYRGLYCSFFPVVELLDAWRPGDDTKKQKGEMLFHRAKNDDLVVLDDIGAEKASEWTGDRLYAVIDARYRMQRATIFTSNCTEKELLNNGYGRIVSRIYEMTEAVQVLGPDHRRKMA